MRSIVNEAIDKLIDALDKATADPDLEDGGDGEPDDTGIADRDALATIEPAQASWFDDDDSG